MLKSGECASNEIGQLNSFMTWSTGRFNALIHEGCHSLVDSSAPTIMCSRIRIRSTPFVLYLSLYLGKDKNKRPCLVHISLMLSSFSEDISSQSSSVFTL